ncbi:beta-propeller fold lactonase family protein [Thiomonas sp. FB-Cd]|uniref:beta-propeller fold lactonase family protein n=1 Tax=Thiomonas sp. FB-Cd TaxID=1158292 RepID=UPI0009DE8586|nr:beta-propeller fold lactonase family protein [Thiomonas sp. FB-Cd]
MNLRAALSFAATALLTLSLTACGGGGDSTTLMGPNTSYQVTGTVAYGHPVAGQTVEAIDSTGTVCAKATTASDGTYAMNTTSCAPGSAALTVVGYTTPNGAPLMAVAVPPQGAPVINGVVNVDPMSTLLSYDAAGLVTSATLPATAGQVLALLPQVTTTQYLQAKASILTAPLLQALATYGVSTTGFDPTTTPFVANSQGLDGFFDGNPFSAPTPSSVQVAAPASAGPLVQVTLPTTVRSQSSVISVSSYTLGGRVSGLSGGSVTLLLNGGNAFTLTANGTFTFPTQISSTYTVTVGTQPTGQTCTVSNGSGAGVTANVSNVSVTCSTNTYTIGGTVSGLASGTQVTLDNNGADPTTVTANGGFTFSTPVAYNGSYAVTVGTQPTGQTCTVSNGSGSGVTANVSNVSVTCSTNTYTIGGTVSGLASGTQVTLDNNGADPTTVTANGGFTFSTPVAYNGSYAVTVGTQPTGQTCTVSNGSGSGVTANVSNVSVTCSTNTYTIGGTVSGLASGTQVTLDNNGADPTTVTANGGFTFSTPVAYNGTYAVTVGTQPTGQTCTVSNGSGAGVTANTSNVAVTCADYQFVYVTNKNGHSVSAYKIDNTTGALTPVAGSPFLTGNAPTSVTVNPTSTFAYVTNYSDDTISAYSINATTGALTPVAGSPFPNPGGGGPQSIAILPTGTFAYVGNSGTFNITGYSINATTGALTPAAGSPFLTGATAGSSQVDVTSLAFSPANAGGQFFLFAVGYSSNVVANYNVDSTTGALTLGSPLNLPNGDNPLSVAVYPISLPCTANYCPSYGYLYAANQNGYNVTELNYNVFTGAITGGNGPTSIQGFPEAVTISRAGTFAYVTNITNNPDGQVLAYSIDPPTGGLTEIAGSPFAAGNTPGAIALNPAGTFAYVVNMGDNTLSAYSINPTTGALTPVPGSPFPTGASPSSVVVAQP